MRQDDHLPISSFVLRFYASDQVNSNQTSFPWRVKVTHVQEGNQFSFDSMEEVTRFFKDVLGEWNR